MNDPRNPYSRNDPPAPPQGEWGGVPYDWRAPSAARAKSRLWNPGDPRLFPPKSFGWGYSLNFYWLCHPLRYLGRQA